MKLIVFSSSDRGMGEAKMVTELFDEGLELFHLRKADFSSAEYLDYINVIPKKYHSRIVLHAKHHLRKKIKVGGLHLSRTHRKKKYASYFKFLTFRLKNRGARFTRTISKISTLIDLKRKYSYVFLSPVYESISKKGHSGNFGNRSLSKYVRQSKHKVIALGGVSPEKFAECKENGFDGVAVLGYIWNNDKSPLEAFKNCKETLKNI